ncbi:MAG: GAF domain-containing protein, partial [Variovorax sp.]
MLPPSTAAPPPERSALIAQARREVFERAGTPASAVGMRIEPWITRSWQRCLSAGRRPQQRVSFDAVSAPHARRTVEQNRGLVTAARPVLDRLSRAIADTRYFAILTDPHGIVVDVRGLPANAQRPAVDLARVGVDLSEQAVGTTAIGAALAELQPVWLHRGEHFFDDTSLYSCAGAPLFGPDGRCVGMLDLTGVDVVERPELRHLAALSARSIENALVLQQPHDLLVRLHWPGYGGGESEGLLCLDGDGHVTGSNAAAREMVNLPLALSDRPTRLHASELFALPWTLLWDAA